jgi:hypothetical protein
MIDLKKGSGIYLYLDSQHIQSLTLGLIDGQGTWLQAPELLNVSPEAYLSGIVSYLESHQVVHVHLGGLLVVSGPGSATALRVGHVLANTLAFVWGIGIMSVKPLSTMAESEIVSQLQAGHWQPSVLPEYANAPKITPSSKDVLKRQITS